MPYYKDIANKVHFLDRDEDEGILPAGCVQITKEEADALLAPTPEELATKAARQAIIDAKAQALLDNIPSWAQVDAAVTNIANLADAKAFIRKLARVVYWLAKDRED